NRPMVTSSLWLPADSPSPLLGAPASCTGRACRRGDAAARAVSDRWANWLSLHLTARRGDRRLAEATPHPRGAAGGSNSHLGTRTPSTPAGRGGRGTGASRSGLRPRHADGDGEVEGRSFLRILSRDETGRGEPLRHRWQLARRDPL